MSALTEHLAAITTTEAALRQQLAIANALADVLHAQVLHLKDIAQVVTADEEEALSRVFPAGSQAARSHFMEKQSNAAAHTESEEGSQQPPRNSGASAKSKGRERGGS